MSVTTTATAAPNNDTSDTALRVIESWTARAVQRGALVAAKRLDANEDEQRGVGAAREIVRCTVHPLLGVLFDWTPLHRRLQAAPPLASADSVSIAGAVASLHAAIDTKVLPATGCSLEAAAGQPLLVTSIATSRLWELVPLTDEARTMFLLEGVTAQAAAGPGGVCERALFECRVGPRGQRPARDSALRIAASVAAQLQHQGVHALTLWGDFLVFSPSFDEALRNTAAVHKALLAGGIPINGAESSFEPRVFRRMGRADDDGDSDGSAVDVRSSLCTRSLRAGDPMALEFLRDVFERMLEDLHAWLCVLPAQSPAQLARGWAAFVRAVRSAPAELWNQATIALDVPPPMRVEPRKVLGPQRWSRAELRLFWLQLARAAPAGELAFVEEISGVGG